MEIAILLILVALLQYLVFTFQTGISRPNKEVYAPKTSGNEIWERMFRVHQNTLEQLIIYIPGVLIFSHYIGYLWVLIPGITFIVGRQIYAITYVKNPKSRTLGFGLTIVSNVALVIGGLIGVLMFMFAQ